MTDGTGTTRYQYDALSRPISVTFPGSRTVQYAYDADGNRTALYYSGTQRAVTYTYDQLDRLISATDWNGASVNYYYDAGGRLGAVALPASTGIVHYFAYDAANRLSAHQYVQGSSNVNVLWQGFSLDAAGNRTSNGLSGSAVPAARVGWQTYTLDALNRLTSVSEPNGTATSYGYDAVGNRTALTTSAGTTSYAYHHADQLTSITPPGQGATSYTYDGNGNQSTRGSDTFSWDAEDRLTTATVGGQCGTGVSQRCRATRRPLALPRAAPPRRWRRGAGRAAGWRRCL
jgi:YD repeat-containing protein